MGMVYVGIISGKKILGICYNNIHQKYRTRLLKIEERQK